MACRCFEHQFHHHLNLLDSLILLDLGFRESAPPLCLPFKAQAARALQLARQQEIRVGEAHGRAWAGGASLHGHNGQSHCTAVAWSQLENPGVERAAQGALAPDARRAPSLRIHGTAFAALQVLQLKNVAGEELRELRMLNFWEEVKARAALIEEEFATVQQEECKGTRASAETVTVSCASSSASEVSMRPSRAQV